MFPNKLNMLDHLRNEKMIKFKEETVDGCEVTIVSYMIGCNELWEQENAIECRGITYDNKTGDCICAPFFKFFNVGERKETLPENLPWADMSVVLEKKDGSMLTPVLINNKVYWKTKKSFYSDVAVEATKNVPSTVASLAYTLLKNGYTPIFEFTSPLCEIVVNYGTVPKFVLLAVRNMATGEHWSYEKVKNIALDFDVEVIKSFDLTYSAMAEQMKTLENFEGYVVQFKRDGATMMAKMKCEWYLRMHRAKTELRERDVADMLLDETLDDIKTVITQAGLSLAPIEAIEHRVTEELRGLVAQVELLLVAAKKLADKKEVAITYREHPLFNLLINAYIGKEPDWKKYWCNNFRDNYSLNTIYSNFKSDDA